MGLIGKNPNSSCNNNDEYDNAKECTVTASPYCEDAPENKYGDIDDLLGINEMNTYYEISESQMKNPDKVKNDNNNIINDDVNGKLMSANSMIGSVRYLTKEDIFNEDMNGSNFNTLYQHNSLALSYSSVPKSSDSLNLGNTQDLSIRITPFYNEDNKYMSDKSDISLNSPNITASQDITNSTTSPNSKKKNIISTPTIARDIEESKGELTHRPSISNFLSHLIPKKNKKKGETKSNPELNSSNDKGYIYYENLSSSPGKERLQRKRRSNTLSVIYNSTSKRAPLNKRSSYIEIQQYNGQGFLPLAPLTIDTVENSCSPVDEEQNSCDIDSILGLIDENNNTNDNTNTNINTNNMNTINSPKNKNKNDFKSSSSFFNNLKRKKDKKNDDSLICLTSSDLMQRKKSYIYSSDAVISGTLGSSILPSYTNVYNNNNNNNNYNNNHILSPQDSNSQFIFSEDVLLSPKSIRTKKKEEKSEIDSYNLPDFSDLLVMSDDDIDGIYENMVKEVSHKKKNINSINSSNDTINNNNNNHSNSNCNSISNSNSTIKVKNKDRDKDKEIAIITPLKSYENINEKSSSPKSGMVIPVSQNNKDDPLRKSFKALGNDNQRSNSYVNSSPRLEEKKLAIDVEEDNIYVVINPYGIRDIDYSTRRVLPVTKKENCSEDVDALFNLESQDKYQESVNKLNEIESTYNQCKNNSRVAVNDPDQPNDIDDLFIFSSDIEKKMTVFDSYIVVDDIQENIRPDIEDILNIVDNEEESQQSINSNNKSSGVSTPSSIGSPKSIVRRISKAFSSGRIVNSNSKIIVNTPINGEDVTNSNNHVLNRVLTPTNLLIIPSYNENSTFEGGACEEEKKYIHCQSNSFDEFRKSQSSIFNRNKARSSNLNQGDLISKSQKEINSLDKINTNNTTKKLEGTFIQPLNYVHSLSRSFSNDGLVVVRSNENVITNDDERVDYIYYNRYNDQKRNHRKGSVMDDFIELSTINSQRQKKIINEANSLSTFKTAFSTVKDYYDAQDEEHSVYGYVNFHKTGSVFSLSNNGNINFNGSVINNNSDLIRRTSNTSTRQRDRLYYYTNVNLIRSEIYYSDYLQSNSNNNLSINNNNFKSKMNQSNNGSVYLDCFPSDYNSNIYNPSQLSLVEEVEGNENTNKLIKETNKALSNSNMNNSINQSNGIVNNYNYNNSNSNINSNKNNNINLNYYLNITNLMNDDQKKNRSNLSLEIPQFTTGYSVNNNYISRMRLTSSIDIFNRLEALNRTKSIQREQREQGDVNKQ